MERSFLWSETPYNDAVLDWLYNQIRECDNDNDDKATNEFCPPKEYQNEVIVLIEQIGKLCTSIEYASAKKVLNPTPRSDERPYPNCSPAQKQN